MEYKIIVGAHPQVFIAMCFDINMTHHFNTAQELYVSAVDTSGKILFGDLELWRMLFTTGKGPQP